MLDWLRAHPVETFVGIVVCAVVSAIIALVILRKSYPGEGKKIIFFFFVMGLVMPFVSLGATLVLSILLRLRKLKEQNIDMENIDLEPLYLAFSKTKRIFGEGAMRVLLHSKKAPTDLKIKALVSLQKDPNRYRLNIIKQALSDRQDEVRLFSFSIIDKFEKRINNKIHEALDRFERVDSVTEKVQSAKELANYYWDMVYFELSDPVLQNFFIKEAKKFTEYVLHHDVDDLSIHILAGKIALKENEFERAQREFALVLESDTHRYDFTVPYLAEIFYQQKNFITAKSLMVNSRQLRYNQQLYPMIALWTEKT